MVWVEQVLQHCQMANGIMIIILIISYTMLGAQVCRRNGVPQQRRWILRGPWQRGQQPRRRDSYVSVWYRVYARYGSYRREPKFFWGSWFEKVYTYVLYAYISAKSRPFIQEKGLFKKILAHIFWKTARLLSRRAIPWPRKCNECIHIFYI